MARIKGADGTINEGAIGDAPVDEGVPVHDGTIPHHEYVKNKGFTLVAPEDDPGSTVEQLAQAVVRGDDLTHPVQRELADAIADRALAIDLTGNPDAEAEDAIRADNEEGQSYRLVPEHARWQPGEDYTFPGVQEAARAQQKESASASKAKPKSGEDQAKKS